ncbi:leukotoxin LktA family filamentous adhesin [Fusobacteria bacterium ZRK30]|nr:leukotoxin LktA family filamentous adhesin [Fusobacteria bacterium ZRK30]
MIKVYSKKYLDTITKTLLVGICTTKISYGEIISHNDGSNISINDNIIDINPEEINGKNAFNEFDKFGLDANKIANMYFNKIGETKSADNLFNFVYDRIKIDGTVNAIKNNKIGGNLFFLSSDGMIVGSKGVINAGSINMITPTEDYMNKIKGNRSLLTGENTTTFKDIKDDRIYLNPQGTITINGSLNAVDKIKLRAGKGIYIGKGLTETELANNILETGISDFSALVNTGDLESGITEENAKLEGIVGDGNIVLSVDSKSLKGDERTTRIAKIEINGNIVAKGDVNITSKISNKTEGELEEAVLGGDITSEVDINGEITGKNINIDSKAETIYKGEKSFIRNIGDEIFEGLEMITPLNIDLEYVSLNNKATINIGSEAKLIANEDVNIASEAITDIEVGAATSGSQMKGLDGFNGWLPSLGMMATKIENSSEVNISGDIKSEGEKIDIKSKGEFVGELSVENSPEEDEKITLGYMYGEDKNSSKIDIGKTANLDSEGSINISSISESTNTRTVEVSTGDGGPIAAAVNISKYESDSTINIDGSLKAKDGIVISSLNEVKDNSISSDNGIEVSDDDEETPEEDADALTEETVKENFAQSIQGIIEKVSEKMGKAPETEEDKEASISDSFKLGGSVLYVKQKNTSNINIGNTAKIISENKNVDITSKVLVDDTNISSNGVLTLEGEDNSNKAAVSGGVLFSDITNSSNIVVEDSTDETAAEISGNEVNIKSEISMEYNRIDNMIQDVLDSVDALDGLMKLDLTAYPIEIIDKIKEIKDKCSAFTEEYPDVTGDKISDKNFLGKFEIFSGEIGELFGTIKDLMDTVSNAPEESPIKKAVDEAIKKLMKVKENALEFGSPKNYSNFYASTKNKGNAEDAASISGSFLDSKLNNYSEITLGRGAEIISSGDINVNSNNKTSVVSVGGQISGQENGSAFGGTVSILENNIKSAINTLEGSKLKGNNININSDTDILDVNVVAGFGSSKNGFNGSASTILGDIENEISIDDETQIIAEDKIEINAKNDLSSVNVAGSVSVGSGKTGSVGLAITDYDIDVSSKIHDNDGDFDGSKKNLTDIKISTGELDVLAENTGNINTISASGTVTKNSDEEDKKPGIIDNIKDKYKSATDKVDSAMDKIGEIFGKDSDEDKTEIDKKMNPEEKISGDEENKSGDSGLTDVNGKNKVKINAAGSVSVNLIDKNTEASIENVHIEFKEGKEDKLNVLGKDSQFIGAFSGAAGIQWQKATKPENQGTKTVGLAGAAAVNKIEKDISASIKNTDILRSKEINVTSLSGGLEIAEGLGLQVANNSGGAAYNGAASISLSLGNSNLTSKMENTDVNTDDSSEKADVDVTSYKTDNQITGGATIQAGKMSVGGGLSVAINTTNSNVKSEIIGGTYQNIENISVKSLMDSETVNTAVAFGAAKSSEEGKKATMLEGAVVYNEIDNDVNSNISGATIDASGNVLSLAKDVDEDSTSVAYYKSLLKTGAKQTLEDKNMAIDYDGSSFYGDQNIEYEKKDNAENEKVKEEDESYGSSIVSVAAAVAAADGNAAGAAVSINNVTNKYSSTIEDSIISTPNSVTSDSDFNSLLVNIAGGIAAGGDKFGGMGSVAWNNIENDIDSNINTSTITGNTINLNSENTGKLVNVAGAFSYGGKVGVGAALAYNNIENNIGSYLTGSEITEEGINSKVKLNSAAEDSVYNIAGGLGFSKDISISGVVAFNEVGGNIESKIDEDENSNKTKTNNIDDVQVKAENDTDVKDIAGNITVGKVSIGGSVAYNNIGGLDSENKKEKVLASINNSIITNSKNITIEGKDNSDLLTIGAGIAGSSKIAIQGAAGVSIINKDVLGEINNTEVLSDEDEKSNIIVESDNRSKIFTSGSVIAVSGKAGIGVGIGVSKITQDTDSKISGGDIKAKNILVKSESNPNITSLGIGIGAGGNLGAAGSVSYNEIKNNNLASIENGAKLVSTGNIGVVANSENVISNYAGTIGVGGRAGAGISTSINKISGSTTAKISGDKTIVIADGSEEDKIITKKVEDSEILDSLIEEQSVALGDNIDTTEDKKSGVVVDALTTNTTKSFVATIGAGGTAGGAATVNINKISGKTEAGIEGAGIGTEDIKSKLQVNAKDHSNSSGFVGSVSAAGTAALGGASDTNILDRDARAYISKTTGNEESLNNIKASDVDVKADSKQGISSLAASLGVAGTAGLSGAVSVIKFDGETKVEVSDYNIISDKDINLLANHDAKVNTGAFSLGGGNNLGLGAGVTVVNSNDRTGVQIDNKTKKDLTAKNDIDIKADNKLKVDAKAISAGAAGMGAGVSGTVEVNNLSNTVFTNINKADISGENVEISSVNDVNFKNILGSGSAGLAAIGAGVSYNTLNSGVKNEILDTDITARDTVKISGKNIRDIKQTAVVAGIGGVSLNANVLITKAGGENITTEVSEKPDYANILQENKDEGSKKLDYANTLQENKNEGSLGYADGDNSVDSKAALSSKVDTLTNNLTNTNITATNNLDVKLNDKTDVDITTVGVGVSAGASAFSSVGIVDIDRNINTNIINSQLKSENNSMNIVNEIGNKDDGKINLKMYQGTGSLGLGASVTYGEVTTSGNSKINLNNTEIEGASINLESTDETIVEAEALGITAGVLAAGAIITEANNTGEIGINLEDTSIEASEKISIKTNKSNEINVNSKGGSFGIASGTGVISTATDSGKSEIELDRTIFKGTDVDITATSSPKITAEAGSLAASLVASAAVSLSEANVKTESNIVMGAHNKFTANNLNIISDVTSDSKDDYTAKAITKGVSAGGIAGSGFNESKAIVNSKSTIDMGKQDYAVENINIIANNTTKQYSDTYGITAGAVASGNNRSLAESNKETTVNLAGGDVKNIIISANTTTDNEVRSQGHGGGLISVDGDGDGLAAKSTNNIVSKTEINIDGNWNVEKDMQILATEENIVYVNADSIKASVVGVSGTKTENTIQDSKTGGTEVNINGNANISGKGSLLAEANNIISSGRKDEYNAEGGSYGGITVQGASSISDIEKSSKINIKDGSSIKTDGSQKYKAYSDLKNYVYSSVKSAGLISGLKSTVENTIDITNAINVEKNTNDSGYKLETLEEDGKITFNSSSDFESVANSKADSQGGVIGAATADTISDITKKNTIAINGSVKSMDDVEIYTGADETGFKNNTKIGTVAEVYNRTVVPVKTKPKVENIINQSNNISIGGSIDSVKDIYLSAKKDDMELNEKSIKYSWVTGTDETGGYSTNAFGTLDNKDLVTDNNINITGNLVAGVQNEIKIKIDGIIAPDGTTIEEVDQSLVVDKPNYTFEGDVDEGSVKFELMNYAANLKNRYEELNELISEYRKEELSQAYYGYVAERQRILDTMGKYDMVGIDNSGGIFIRSEITIPTVEIDNLVASGGNIVLDTDTLNGTGSLTAKGAPKIEIENNSNTYLKINDLKIGNLGGEVLYNNKNLNSGKLENINVTTSDPGDASIRVSSNWNGSMKVEFEGKDGRETSDFQPITSIEVNGDIENSLGIVDIKNIDGDILIQGKTAKDSASINGSEVNLTASGSVSQGFSEGIVNIGGDPLAKWSDAVEETEDKYIDPNNKDTSATVNTDKTAVEYDGTRIAGDSIYINASDVNLNGYIQSGYADYVMNFSTNDKTKIANLDKDWDGKTISDIVIMNNKNYKLNANGGTNILDDNGHYKKSVDVYYNPSTKEIITPDINTSGGKVYIMGRIASTGSGKIAVLNGTSNVNFDTSSLDRTLKVGDIYTNNVKGIVKIVDFNKLNADNTEGLVTEYKDGVGGIYNPKTNLRYNWSTGKATETKTYYTYTKKTYGWGLWSTKSGLEMVKLGTVKDIEIKNGDPKRSGEFISSTTDNELTDEYGYIYNGAQTSLTASDVYKDVLKSYFFGAYKKIKYSWNTKVGESHNFLHSVKADKPITVEFFGNEVGSINLNSDNNINLDGNIKVSNSNSTINLNAGENINFNDHYITGDNISINSDYMTELNSKTLGADLNLDITLGGGDAVVNVERIAGNTESKGNLNVENLEVSNVGDVTLNADGNINSKNVISGNRIDLNSREGNIDLKVNVSGVPVNPNDTLSSSLNAVAQGDIILSQASGDLRIGTINSKGGDITLNVSDGGLVDALPTGEQLSEGTDELIENWKNMGLIGDKEGVLSAEEAYKEMKTEEFNKYTYLKSLNEKNETQKVMYDELDSKYSKVSNIDEYLDSDSTYEQLKTNKWTEDELLYAMKDSITHQKSNFGDKEIKDPNIVGGNITLNINGGVGTDKATETISLVNLMENKEALIKLSNAEASDVIWDNDKSEAQIRGKAPIGILMGEDGKINIDAKDNIYLVTKAMEGESKAQSIYIDNITAVNGSDYKNVRINTDEGIFNAKINDDINNIVGNEIFLGSNGNIGTLNKYVTVNPSSYLKAESEKSIYIKGENDLNLGRVYAKGDIYLEANNILTDNDYIDGEGTINLSALNNIGSVNNFLQIANGSGVVNGTGENIYLSSSAAGKTEGSINLGEISSTEDLKVYSSKGISLRGNTTADDIDLEATNDIELLNEKEIKARKIKVASEGGKINQEENKLTISESSDFKAKNGIDLKNIENKLTSIDLSNERGSVLINNNDDLNLNFKGLNDGLININNKNGNLNFLSDVVSTGENSEINLSTNSGNIRLKDLNSDKNTSIKTVTGNIKFGDITTSGTTIISTKETGDITGINLLSSLDTSISTKSGDIDISNLVSDSGNVNISAERGNVDIETSQVARDNSILTREGSITLGNLDVAGNNNIETTKGDIKFGNITTLGRTTISTKETGDITGINLLSNLDTDISTKSGDIDISNLVSDSGNVDIKTSQVARDNSILTREGSITLGNLDVAGNNNIETTKGDIKFGNITTLGRTTISTKETGDITGINLLSNLDTDISTKSGDIDISNLVSDSGNVKISTERGNVDIKTSQVARDNSILTREGSITLGSLDVAGNNNIETTKGDIKFGNITTLGRTTISTKETGDITGTNLASTLDTDISTKAGDIDISNLVSDSGNVELTTETGNISSDQKVVSLNDSLKVYAAKGDIVFNELFSKNDTSITADSGNINIIKADGENLIIVLKDQKKVLTAETTVAGKNLSVFGNKMDFDKISQRDREDKLTLNLKNSDAGKSVKYINIADITANETNEILFKPLWVDDIYMRSGSKKVTFPQLNVVNLGHISNKDTNVTIFGKETLLDNADIDLHFKASQDKLWAKLDFNRDYHKITTDAKLVRNEDYFYVYDQKISDVNSAGNETGVSKQVNNFKNQAKDKEVDEFFKNNIVNSVKENKPVFGENILNEIDFDFAKKENLISKIKVLPFDNNGMGNGEENE